MRETRNAGAVLPRPVAREWRATALESGLRARATAAGLSVFAGDECLNLVRELRADAPTQVVVFAAPDVLSSVMAVWDGVPPCPVSLVSALPDAAVLDRLYALGLAGWWPDSGLAADVLAAGLAQDRIRWQREAALRRELHRLSDKLDERKWLDRAKGVLIQARGLDEEGAFKLLRNAAMHSRLPVGQVSRSVVEAAVWAGALNRAGQLRMLSQRIVKLAAQRAAGVEVHRAGRLQAESEQRVETNLDYLAALPQLRCENALWACLTTTRAAWSALQASLAQRRTPALLRQADADASVLLQCAEELVGALQTASHRSALSVVNLCGRQRMLVQRFVKEALLAEVISGGAGMQALVPVKSEFEAALFELDHAAFSSPEIRQALAVTRREWKQLLHDLRALKPAEGRLVASRASEALLTAFDDLTVSYERSMQVIMS